LNPVDFTGTRTKRPACSLYAGITSNLAKRVFQHKKGVYAGFTSRYKIDRLVYYERFVSVQSAIAREKQIKGLLRLKKLALIVSMNPKWKDLSEGWYEQYQPGKCIDPSSGALRSRRAPLPQDDIDQRLDNTYYLKHTIRIDRRPPQSFSHEPIGSTIWKPFVGAHDDSSAPLFAGGF
jgi:putative endonuclease